MKSIDKNKLTDYNNIPIEIEGLFRIINWIIDNLGYDTFKRIYDGELMTKKNDTNIGDQIWQTFNQMAERKQS